MLLKGLLLFSTLPISFEGLLDTRSSSLLRIACFSSMDLSVFTRCIFVGNTIQDLRLGWVLVFQSVDMMVLTLLDAVWWGYLAFWISGVEELEKADPGCKD